jgi:hypothetical protein
MKPVKLSELISAIEGQSEENVTRVDLKTGEVVMVDEFVLHALEEDDEEALSDLADWQKPELEIARAMVADSGERFLEPPDKFDFHEYRQMERFIRTVYDPEAADELWRAIKGKRAFRYFKDTVHRLGLREEWCRFRDDALKELVIDWAEAKKVPYEDDLENAK